MRLIDRKRILEAIAKYPKASTQLKDWYLVMKHGKYQNLAELRQTYPHADQVGRATVFNIKGNHYRLISSIHYNSQTVFILEVLTHEEYNTNAWKKTWSVFD
jgi:mRNA interferase HigB